MTQLVQPARTTTDAAPGELTKFADPLRIPPTITPDPGSGDDGGTDVTVLLTAAEVRLHSELPPTPMWTYQGSFPGPTIQVRRGQRLRVAWENRITTPYPAQVGNIPAITMPPAENVPGIDPALLNQQAAALPSWTVTHLHGAVTGGGQDGWTDNAVLPGGSQLSEYPNDQAATALWYHDHAMGITRLNVYAGLAGLYLVRDDEEDGLGLPGDEFEVPLVLCDRNLATAPDGSPTGQLLYKTVGPLPFAGRYTLVNGGIWPHFEVRPRWYRFRVLNASNARAYRLHLVDETGQRVPDAVWQIGTDSGLLGAPVPLPGHGLTLSPAERADLLVDFGALAGRTLRLVNSAPAPYDGQTIGDTDPVGVPDPANRLPDPEVMEFRVAAAEPDPDPFTLPPVLAGSFQRLTHEALPADHNHRVLMLGRTPGGTFQLWETAEAAPGDVPPPGTVRDGIVQVQQGTGPVQTYRRISGDFNDTLNWRVRQDAWEVWTIINLTVALHPVHIHLIRFQLLTRAACDVSAFQQANGGTPAGSPVTWSAESPIDPADQGWKDTIKIPPGGLVRIAGQFTGATGKFMYHCHLLDHEDDGMMRPFTVTPGAVQDFTGMGGMGGMNM
ncbi:multicopper oxidase domain-containing protein [Kitasatospora kazusensis]|uniref:Multicopper oxidase domain-containing protein n=1 Tax=Kitasatospora kazusensis TaxID=407974 RepID=A0ABN2Z1S3_9ACTN